MERNKRNKMIRFLEIITREVISLITQYSRGDVLYPAPGTIINLKGRSDNEGAVAGV